MHAVDPFDEHNYILQEMRFNFQNLSLCPVASVRLFFNEFDMAECPVEALLASLGTSCHMAAVFWFKVFGSNHRMYYSSMKSYPFRPFFAGRIFANFWPRIRASELVHRSLFYEYILGPHPKFLMSSPPSYYSGDAPLSGYRIYQR
jgi:hypothetical protein